MLNVSASFMNGGAGHGVVEFFHGFQVALMMTVMLNLTQFVYWRCKMSRRGTCWNVYNPVLWVFISAVLVNVQPMMILINGSFQICCAPCSFFEGSPAFVCPATGMSLPPWGDGKARECNWSGNQFWDESYCNGSKLPTFPSKLEGWMIQVFCTWGGFVFMFVGILQATQLHRKFAKRWRAIRTGRA